MDFGQIESLLGLAATATGITEKAASTAGAVKKLFTGDKAPNKDEASSLVNELAAQLTVANMTNVQISSALRVLSTDMKAQDDFEREKARYELFETPKHDMVYRLRNELADGQPIHFICPVCLSKHRLFSFISGEGDYKKCQADSQHIFKFQSSPVQQYSRSRNTGW